MYSAGVLYAILGGVIIWLLILSYLAYQERIFLKKLFPKDSQGEIRDKLREVLQAVSVSRQECQSLNKNLREVSKEGLRHIQRVALLRYNPYQDTGGDQSFSLALMDGRGDGIVITSLHTRSGTRVYTKSVSKGKSEIQLSKEEQEVVSKALTE